MFWFCGLSHDYFVNFSNSTQLGLVAYLTIIFPVIIPNSNASAI
jgi:hypothetical protein